VNLFVVSYGLLIGKIDYFYETNSFHKFTCVWHLDTLQGKAGRNESILRQACLLAHYLNSGFNYRVFKRPTKKPP